MDLRQIIDLLTDMEEELTKSSNYTFLQGLERVVLEYENDVEITLKDKKDKKV